MSFLVPGGPKMVPVFFSSGCSSTGCRLDESENELMKIVEAYQNLQFTPDREAVGHDSVSYTHLTLPTILLV